MKNLFVSHTKGCVASLIVVALVAVPGANTTAQEAAVEVQVENVVEAFYEAAAEGDLAAAGRLTHVDAKLFGVRNDKLMQMPLTMWPSPVRSRDGQSVEVGTARVAGASAVVEVRTSLPKARGLSNTCRSCASTAPGESCRSSRASWPARLRRTEPSLGGQGTT